MPIKSSRFSRAAYSRRAALLAEDLIEWSRIYSRRSYGDYTNRRTAETLAVYDNRAHELADLGQALQRISIALQALR